jgi:hypothetical protein
MRSVAGSFFHCDEDGDLMICDTFQTLISRELPPEQRASDIEKSMQGDPVKEFREGIGRDCDKMKEMARVSKTGKGTVIGVTDQLIHGR